MKVRAVADVPFLAMDILVRTPEEVKQRLAIGDFFVKDILSRGKVLYRKPGYKNPVSWALRTERPADAKPSCQWRVCV